MSISKCHEEWLSRVCKACSMPESEIPEALERSAFCIGDVMFGFMPSIVAPDKQLAVHGIIGEVPADRRVDMLGRALEMQMMTASTASQMFGYDTIDDQLILIQPVDVDDTPPETMAPILRLMCSSIQSWREIIATPEGKPAVESGAGAESPVSAAH